MTARQRPTLVRVAGGAATLRRQTLRREFQLPESGPFITLPTTTPRLGDQAGPGSRPGRVVAGVHRHGPGLLMAIVTAAMMAWGLPRVALWLDESASVLATQRTWPQLWVLLDGAEAPLVPYYAVLKAFTDTAVDAVPSLANHPEILFRLPSVIVTVLAVWVLVSWLTRVCSARLGLLTGAVVLSTAGFSRYGQEARPYALLMFCTVLATVAWSHLVAGRSWRWAPLYAFSLASMIALNTLGAMMLAVYLVAAPLCAARGRRRRALLWTLSAAVPALLAVAPLVSATVANGTGPLGVRPATTPEQIYLTFSRLFSLSEQPWLGVGPVVLLAAVGIVRWNGDRYRVVVRLATCWALLPLIGLVLVVLLFQPNLLLGRYVAYVLPGWAILAAVGTATLAEGAAALTAWLPGLRPVVGRCVGLLLAVALVVTTALQQEQSLTLIRLPGGHGEDIRPALAAASLPQNAGLPIMVSSRSVVSLVGASRPDLEGRLIAQRFQRDQNLIWPVDLPVEQIKETLKTHPKIILLLRLGADPACQQTEPLTPTAVIERCMPNRLRVRGYRVLRQEPSGRGWAFAVLARTQT